MTRSDDAGREHATRRPQPGHPAHQRQSRSRHRARRGGGQRPQPHLRPLRVSATVDETGAPREFVFCGFAPAAERGWRPDRGGRGLD